MATTRGQRPDLRERATGRMDVRAELARLETMIKELKVEYEQHFLGLVQYTPTKQHKEVERVMRAIRRAPFKNSEQTYRLRSLENRFQTYNNYWQRILRQRDAGTYHRDVFKANLREKYTREQREANTARGRARKQMQDLYSSYKTALEQQSGAKQKVDFDAFQKSLSKRAREYKKKHGDQRLTFKVVVKNGKVAVQAKAKK